MRTTGHPITPLTLTIDRNDKAPLYRQLSIQLRSAISLGRLPPGSRLENEITLAGRLGISRPTVRRAIQELVADGLISRRRGIGTRVAHIRIHTRLDRIDTVKTLAQEGHRPTTSVLESTIEPAIGDIAEQLEIPVGEPVLYVRRLLSANRSPLAILENFLPAARGTLAADALDSGDLHTLLRSIIRRTSTVAEQLTARASTLEESILLGAALDGPILERHRITRSAEGRVVDAARQAYRGDLIAIHSETGATTEP